MSIRISLYDFFAHTVPGVFYVLVVVYGLAVFGVIDVDLRALNDLSLFAILLLIGTGYIVGNLLDLIAYRWYKLFYGGSFAGIVDAFKQFKDYHPWLELEFEPGDWGILLYAVKSNSSEVADRVEQHMVASIMLRNVSLGLFLASVLCLAVYYSIGHSVWNVLLFGTCFGMSVIAIQRSNLRRRWFYLGILEAYTAYRLLQGNWAGDKLYVVDRSRVTEPQEAVASTAAPEASSDSTEAG